MFQNSTEVSSALYTSIEVYVHQDVNINHRMEFWGGWHLPSVLLQSFQTAVCFKVHYLELFNIGCAIIYLMPRLSLSR